MSSLPLEIVVLAAGKGTRMRSDRPKVLHVLGGRPLILHVLEAARGLAPQVTHVVVGHGAARVEEAVAPFAPHVVLQVAQRGTGDAVAAAAPAFADDAVVLVLYGDVPLIQPATLAPLIEEAAQGALALLTMELSDPTGYGRILREQGEVVAVVEEKDAGIAERAIREVNTGVLAAPARRLRAWLQALQPNNAQGEYYLTDVVALAHAEGCPVRAHLAADPGELQGVNHMADLAAVERALQRRHAAALMHAGVQLLDPARFDLRGTLRAGRDVRIDVGVVLEGNVVLGANVYLGPYVQIRDCLIEDGARIEAHSVLEGAQVAAGAAVGPFARLRPGARLGAGSRVGNFVEIKKSDLGPGTKVNHLSYIGDAEVGARVNIGAGVITCNYDGVRKHRTRIGDDASIGADTQLVAPVAVGPGATIGAGSTITEDAPEGTLTLSRVRQKSVPGWKRPRKPE